MGIVFVFYKISLNIKTILLKVFGPNFLEKELAGAVGIPVGRCSGSQLATTLVATIKCIIFSFFVFFSLLFSSLSTFLMEWLLGSKNLFCELCTFPGHFEPPCGHFLFCRPPAPIGWYYWSEIFFEKILYLEKLFLYRYSFTNEFLDQIFLDPTYLRRQNFFGPKIFLDSKIFSSLIFYWNCFWYPSFYENKEMHRKAEVSRFVSPILPCFGVES